MRGPRKYHSSSPRTGSSTTAIIQINFFENGLFADKFRRAVLPIAVRRLNLYCNFASFGTLFIGYRLCLAWIGGDRVGRIVGRICHTARKNCGDDEQIYFQDSPSRVVSQILTLLPQELKRYKQCMHCAEGPSAIPLIATNRTNAEPKEFQ